MFLEISNCRANLEVLQNTLDEVCPTDEPTSILKHIGELASLIGLSANTQASLKFHLAQQMQIHLPNAKKAGMPPSLMREYAESCMPELVAEYELSERLNRGITHKCEFYRSCLSYLKQENYHSNMQQG